MAFIGLTCWGGEELGCGLAGDVCGSAAKSNLQGHLGAQKI